jgi:uridine kinase
MIVYDKKFENEAQIKAFIAKREYNYRRQVETIAEIIAKDERIKIITLCGPSCAGKTTTSYILENKLEDISGIDLKIISIDDFFKNRDEMEKSGTPDFESIESIDFGYFKECVENILAGKATYLPHFDFVSGKRSEEYEKYIPHEKGIVVFEGIQAMYPEITAILPAEHCVSLFIDILEDVWAYGSFFTHRDVRFYRRLVRDFQFRGASVAKTLELWKNVKSNEEKNIYPYSDGAKYTINSSMLYELNVIKKYLLEMLDYTEATRFLFEDISEKFKNIPDIPAEYVPKDSVFREFIG